MNRDDLATLVAVIGLMITFGLYMWGYATDMDVRVHTYLQEK